MQERNRVWVERLGLAGVPYQWDLDSGTVRFTRADGVIVADLCLVGTVSESEGTYLWGWANETLPTHARHRLDEVREFGHRHGLGLLTDPEWPGGRAEGLEMLSVAGRILDADGALVDTAGDVTLFFALFHFRLGR